MNKTKEFLDEIVLMIDSTEDQLEKMQLIIEYGEDILDIDEKLKIEENKVQGCVSNVYLSFEIDKKRKVIIKSSSEALIIKGYLGILTLALKDLTPAEIIDSIKDIEQFTIDSNLKSSLTPSRANAFGNILDMIKQKVLEF